MANVFYIKQGDRQPSITGIAQDADGNVASGLSGATAKFIMAPAGGGAAVIDAACTLNTGTGALAYAWGASDTTTVGRYIAEFKVTYADATVGRFPNDGYITVIISTKLA